MFWNLSEVLIFRFISNLEKFLIDNKQFKFALNREMNSIVTEVETISIS